MRIKEKDIIFDDDINVADKKIDGYLWATETLVKMANYKKKDADDYINLYQTYNIKKDEWYVEASGVMNKKYFTKSLDLTEEETDYIAEKMIEYYFGTKENWNDFIKEVLKNE